MRGFRRQSVQRSLRRTLISSVTLLAHVVVAFGVAVPADVEPASEPVTACGCARGSCSEGQCCCVHHQQPPSNQAPPTVRRSTASAGNARGLRWVSGIAVLKCRGQSTLWVGAGLALPVPTPLPAPPVLDPAGLLSYRNEIAQPSRSAPPVPPPRLGVS